MEPQSTSEEYRKLSTNLPQRKISTVPESDIYTLTRHLMIQQQQHSQATGDFTLLMTSIQLACKFICSKVNTAGISHVIGIMGGDKNASGDTQKKLDVIADEVFIKALRSSGKVCVMVTEEQEKPIVCEEYLDAKYVVAFDPLDGSSNIDANVSIGSIFAIWKRKSQLGTQPTQEDIQQSGDECVSAGYCLYGSSCIMVIGNEAGVNGYTLDPNLGEFILTHPRMRIPKKGNQYSINEGNSIYWNKPVEEYINHIKHPAKGKSTQSLRYIGSMVADVHRVILYGGTFLYPTDQKSKSGKLRLLYEAIPMSFVMEKAGGQAMTDNQDTPCKRILALKPSKIHERCGIILGSNVEIEEIKGYFQQEKQEEKLEEKQEK